MKIVKVAFKVLLWLVALVVVAVLTLPLWFGPVAKTAANAVVPGIAKTDFRIGRISLNPYTARFELDDLNLSNPKGYSETDAVRVGNVIFDAETLSLMTDIIHVEEISIRDLFVSVVRGGENAVMNFTQIQYNVAGGKEKFEAAPAEPAAPMAEPAVKQDMPAKKIIIDRLEISGLNLQLGVLPIRMPSVVLSDIGRKSGGVTAEEAWRQIVDGIMKATGVTSDRLKALGVSPDDAMKKANEALSKGPVRAATVVGDAAKRLSASTKAATDIGSGGPKAVREGTKAVGGNAKKAIESLKGLW